MLTTAVLLATVSPAQSRKPAWTEVMNLMARPTDLIYPYTLPRPQSRRQPTCFYSPGGFTGINLPRALKPTRRARRAATPTAASSSTTRTSCSTSRFPPRAAAAASSPIALRSLSSARARPPGNPNEPLRSSQPAPPLPRSVLLPTRRRRPRRRSWATSTSARAPPAASRASATLRACAPSPGSSRGRRPAACSRRGSAPAARSSGPSSSATGTS